MEKWEKDQIYVALAWYYLYYGTLYIINNKRVFYYFVDQCTLLCIGELLIIPSVRCRFISRSNMKFNSKLWTEPPNKIKNDTLTSLDTNKVDKHWFFLFQKVYPALFLSRDVTSLYIRIIL